MTCGGGKPGQLNGIPASAIGPWLGSIPLAKPNYFLLNKTCAYDWIVKNFTINLCHT